MKRSLARENQFNSRDEKHRRETERDHSNGKTPAPQMRAGHAANNCSSGKDEAQRRNRTDFCKVTKQPGNRIHPNKQRGDSSSLTNVGPAAKQQEWSEKYSAASASEPREKSETCSDAYRRQARRWEHLWGVTAVKEKARRREEQNNSDQNPENRSRRLYVTAQIRSWNGQQREWPEQFPREMTGTPKLEGANRSDQDVQHKRRRTNDDRCYSKQRHGCDVTRRTCVTD